MQGLALEMLVDHYPLRRVVREGCTGIPPVVHSMHLLAEAMAGSEVLLLVSSESTETNIVPLTFSMGRQTFLVAGTTLEYADNLFVQYLGSRVVEQPMMMHQMDARDLVLLAVSLGTVNGILFDMNIEADDEKSFENSMFNSVLMINDLTRRAVENVNLLMDAEPGEDFKTLPSPVLSLLAREEDSDERRKSLSGYLSHRSEYELSRIVLFLDKNVDDQTAYTTLARGMYEKMALFQKDGIEKNEYTFEPVSALYWLKQLANAGGKRMKLDGRTTISGRFARSVLGIDGSLS